MKKIMILVLLCCSLLAGCGNMAVLDPGNFTFNHLHTDTYHDPMCFTVEKWWNNENGIEVDTKECGPMYFSEGDYIQIVDGDNCPYCGGDPSKLAVPLN